MVSAVRMEEDPGDYKLDMNIALVRSALMMETLKETLLICYDLMVWNAYL